MPYRNVPSFEKDFPQIKDLTPEQKRTAWEVFESAKNAGDDDGTAIAKAISTAQRVKASELPTRLLSLAEIPISEQQLENTEFQVLRVGEFYDPRYKTFRIDEALLQQLKDNFDAKVLGVDVALDVNHAPENGAYAWIKSLSIRNGGLWATFKDITATAQQYFREKIYKYFSVEFAPFETVQDGKKVTIKNVLRGIALTNRPVIKGMQPTFFSETANKSLFKSRSMNALKVFAEHVVQRGRVTKEDVAAAKLMFASLSEEEQTEAKPAVDQVEAEAVKTEQADADKAKADADAKAAEDAKKAEDEKKPEEVKAAELSTARTQLAEANAKIAKFEEEKASFQLAESVKSVTFSDNNLTGFSAQLAEEKVKPFLATLSDEQRAQFGELVKAVTTIDKTMLAEVGGGAAGNIDDSKEKTDDEMLAEAEKKAKEYMEKDPKMAYADALVKAQKEVFAKKA